MTPAEQSAEPTGFDALIEAFQIFRRYGNPDYPTHCEHDELTICGIDPAQISAEDVDRLNTLGFDVDTDAEAIYSFRYGSA